MNEFKQIPGIQDLTTKEKQMIYSNLVNGADLESINKDMSKKTITVTYIHNDKRFRYTFPMHALRSI